MTNLEPLNCIRCRKTACYIDESYVEDVSNVVYCENCVKILPKEKTES